jgi:phosphate transport system substrate-binding protein
MRLMNDGFGLRGIIIAGSLGLMVLGAVMVGCGKQEIIVIRGSNTFGEELAPQLVVAFRKEHPSVMFDAEFKGTTFGMGALMVGRCDIAAASRPVSMNELQLAKERNVEFDDNVIGAYSVAVIVNANNPVGDLSRDQVRDIFTGVITNWADVGGPKMPILLCSRDEVSGTYLGFRELTMDNKPYALGLKVFTNYLGIIQKVAQEPGGVGYTSIDLVEKDGIKAVSIGGVAPTAALVNRGQYPYVRVLHLYTDKSKETPMTQSFVEFVESKRGQEILARMGFVPHP